MYQEIDYEKLRRDLIDYYGTAFSMGFQAAIIEISTVERASQEKLIELAQSNGFDLTNYSNSPNKRR